MGARKFVAAESRDLNIVSAKAFNREYDRLKGTLNGGLDRTASPNEYITRGHLANNALHVVDLTKGVELATGFQVTNNSSYTFDSLSYDIYAGGWASNTTINTSGLQEGFVHVELSFFAWMNHLYSEFNPKGVQFRLTWNGNVVAQTGFYFTPWPNPYICCDFPVSGDGSLELSWQYSSPYPDTDGSGLAQMYFGGGQLLLISRHR